jgi:16S rRNA (adenine1518-N6/adenine1519-N6)-dimethyltransferase
MQYRHKKQFGQHFLRDEAALEAIVQALKAYWPEGPVWEIGPGQGVLTRKLLQHEAWDLYLTEIDRDLQAWLREHISLPPERWLDGDFLRVAKPVEASMALTGNFPYQISTEILFRLLDEYPHLPVMVGMFQREVAQRVAAKEGSKTYGVTSVLVQAFFEVEYLFELPPEAFNPPPQVHSAVIRLRAKPPEAVADIPLKSFKTLVKAAFGQRRKTLKNALLGLHLPEGVLPDAWKGKRAEQLPVAAFEAMARSWKKNL